MKMKRLLKMLAHVRQLGETLREFLHEIMFGFWGKVLLFGWAFFIGSAMFLPHKYSRFVGLFNDAQLLCMMIACFRILLRRGKEVREAGARLRKAAQELNQEQEKAAQKIMTKIDAH